MRISTLIALAGVAAGAAAEPERITLTNQRSLPTDCIGQIYYNLATGEFIKTSPTHHRDGTAPRWINELYDQCSYGEWFHSPIRDSATGEDTWWADWGDVADNTIVDCMTFLYATDVPDPEEDGEDGFEVDVSFFDGLDISSFGCGLTDRLYFVYTVTDIPGAASGLAGWLVTIDVSGGGEFEVGDSDGIDDSGNGIHSGGLGVDVDADGKADFGYGFNFRHPPGLTTGATGCGLVVPPEGVVPNSLGDIDAMALCFLQDWDNIDGLYWFGGYDCSGGPGNWTPWASYYLGLYGPDDLFGECGDYTGDGVLDFFDVQAWLSLFAAGDPRADMNDDGVFDFFDVQIFLGIFSAGCP